MRHYNTSDFLKGAEGITLSDDSVAQLDSDADIGENVNAPEVTGTSEYPLSGDHVAYDKGDGYGPGLYDADNRGMEDLRGSFKECSDKVLAGSPQDAIGHCIVDFNGSSGAVPTTLAIPLVKPLQLFDTPEAAPTEATPKTVPVQEQGL